MSALRELQRDFAAALLARDAGGFSARVRADRLPAAARFQVYRNNVFISLTQALADVYPVARRLVGEAFFDQLARRFIRTHPSRSGNLHEFGRELPAFCGALRETQALPYLADVAALEWAYHEVFHAADAAPLDVARLGQMPEAELDRLRFVLHPATRLVASRHPILAIWEANQGAPGAEPEVGLDAGPDHLLVARRNLDRWIARLTAGELVLLAELAAARPLGAACEAAASAQPGIDLGATMGRFVADRTLTAFHHA